MRLKEWLHTKKIRANSLADSLGLSRQTLYTYMQKGTDIRLSTAFAINKATAGDVSFQELFQHIKERRSGRKKRKNIAKKST